jgi:hypothetical protein
MMRIEITNKLKISGIFALLVDEVKTRLTFQNPRWLENEKMGHWNGKTPAQLQFYEIDANDDIVVPRGFARQLITLCRFHGVSFHIDVRRRTLLDVDIRLGGCEGGAADCIGQVQGQGLPGGGIAGSDDDMLYAGFKDAQWQSVYCRSMVHKWVQNNQASGRKHEYEKQNDHAHPNANIETASLAEPFLKQSKFIHLPQPYSFSQSCRLLV